MPTWRIGSRGSRLAQTMVTEVLDHLNAAHPEHTWVRRTIMSAGDQDRTSSLRDLASAGAGVFAGAVEQALLDGEIDVAVHSLKDLPTATTPGTVVAAIPRRHEVRDALCGTALDALAPGHRVGTGAPRRVGQLHHACPGVVAVPIRGNVPPRLRQMREKGLSGVVLAAAGLHRLGLQESITEYLDPARWPPSPAQGAIAVQVRTADTALARVVAAVHDEEAAATTRAERALMAILGGGCHVPIGAYATIRAGGLHLLAQVTSTDGSTTIRAEATGAADQPEMVGEHVAQRLLDEGVEAALASSV
ncbi:hydroxymethylbilane synthase [Nocardiopsis metallicus]|uniref:Hydroxymethylbilane synthase n=1 Tax=Nocardiopsis metallicus TaxID=179819 RepID=A0A840WEJ0_9ACTN|nr:hydroxymethylbilane synthase [Nocardiopsis metallicus]MBB5491431.1 hydroxymethylbilane synthase [Nocardiopsis metallicus]